MNYTDLAATVTARLVDAIEAGTGTWSAPWHRVPGLFDVRNATTGHPYRGANTITLALAALDAGHPRRRDISTGWWATYRQWSEPAPRSAEARPRPGSSSGSPPARNDPAEDADRVDEESGRRLVPKVYPVFNAAQVDGWTPPQHQPSPRSVTVTPGPKRGSPAPAPPSPTATTTPPTSPIPTGSSSRPAPVRRHRQLLQHHLPRAVPLDGPPDPPRPRPRRPLR